MDEMSVRIFGRNVSRTMASFVVLLFRINPDERQEFYPEEVHFGKVLEFFLKYSL